MGLDDLFELFGRRKHHGRGSGHHKQGHHGQGHRGSGYYDEREQLPRDGRSEARCSSCGQLSPSGAKFCPQCGQSLQPGACRACGADLDAGAKFCAQCGTARG